MAEEAHGVLKFTAPATDSRVLFIRRMEWDGSLTAGDDLIVTDKNDKELWVVNNKEANSRASIDLGCQYTNGLKVATIDAGTLYVYTK